MIYSLNYDIFTDMTVGAWGCDRSVEDAYSSMASDPISDYCNSPNLLCAYLIFFFWNFFGTLFIYTTFYLQGCQSCKCKKNHFYYHDLF